MHRKNRCGCALLCVLVLCALCMPAAAARAEGVVVRVGYFDLGAYYTVREDGSLDSYDAAFLDEIARYTGYRFEYVDCGTWSHALEMLNAHEIDLVGTMQWTAEREAQYEICDAGYGYSVAELAALPDSERVFEDYAAISGARVGCVDGYVIRSQLNSFTHRKNLSITLKTYPTQTELDRALECGEIDLVAANAHAVHADWKVIEKFAYAPFYFASWKGNAEVTEAISAAIIQIHVYQTNFADSLIKTYFPQLVSAPFSKLELDLIADAACYQVYFDDFTAPLAWLDAASGEMCGVLPDVCAELAAQTGLRLEPQLRTGDVDAAEDGTVNYRLLLYGVGSDAREEPGVTDSILDQDFEMYHRIGGRYQDGGAYSIAIVDNRDGLRDYLAQSYPRCTMVECETPAACLKLLDAGDVDLCFLNTNVAEHIAITDGLDQITAIPMTRVVFGIGLEFHGAHAEMLAGIVDKGIHMMDEGKIGDALLSYALNTSPNMTLGYLIRQHLPLTIGLCAAVVVMLAVSALLFLYAKLMRRQRIQVEQANRARTDFFSRMSHDMRTPMNGILGMIALTKQARSMDEVRGNMEKAESAGAYMLSLINDTLDLQRLESGRLKFNLQTVEAATFFRDMLEMAESSALQKGLIFRTELPQAAETRYLRLDPIRVKQVLTNLTSNAIKFTPRGGEVRVFVERLSATEDAAKYRFRVQDSGVGMSREFIAKNLYQAYAQEHNSASDQYAGSGLGLAITKNLVELMGGQISVESELGEGCLFTVELEFERVDPADAARSLHAEACRSTQVRSGLKGRRILLAEDHPLNAEIVMRLLDKAACEVVWAKDGAEAVERFKTAAPGEFHAILMDIRMPVMDGMQAARIIRAMGRPDARTVPIIALSANAYDEDVRACINAGMTAHLAKPVNPTELYAELKRYIG